MKNYLRSEQTLFFNTLQALVVKDGVLDVLVGKELRVWFVHVHRSLQEFLGTPVGWTDGVDGVGRRHQRLVEVDVDVLIVLW